MVPQPALGHRGLLVGVLLLGFFNVLAFIRGAYDFSQFGLFYLVVLVASVIVVFTDATAINRAKGRDVVSAVGWAFLVLFFWIIAMPWYVFSRRGKAVSVPALAGPGQDALEALRRLGELKEKGVVSEDEFQRKKQELLGRI